MSLTVRQWFEQALCVVGDAERDLGRLSAGQKRDLLKDNLDVGSELANELADKLEARERGHADRLAGRAAYYGCHFGMRSTREASVEAYHAGWSEIDRALRGVQA